MRTALAIAWKEIQAYFTNPMGYIVALVYLALTGYFFGLDVTGVFPQATIESYIGPRAFILILLAPAMTMRLMAEEQKLGTIELLLTSPVRDWEVVLGKFIASLIFFVGTLSLTLYYVVLLYAFGNPDTGPIWSGYLGLILYGASALAIGLLASSLTSNQIVALVVGFGFLLIMGIVNRAATLVDGTAKTVLIHLDLTTHLDDFSRGIIDTSHIVYYITVILVFLFLTVRSVETRRWR